MVVVIGELVGRASEETVFPSDKFANPLGNLSRYEVLASSLALMVEKNATASKNSISLPIDTHKVVCVCLSHSIRTLWHKRSFFTLMLHVLTNSEVLSKHLTRGCLIKP